MLSKRILGSFPQEFSQQVTSCLRIACWFFLMYLKCHSISRLTVPIKKVVFHKEIILHLILKPWQCLANSHALLSAFKLGKSDERCGITC